MISEVGRNLSAGKKKFCLRNSASISYSLSLHFGISAPLGVNGSIAHGYTNWRISKFVGSVPSSCSAYLQEVHAEYPKGLLGSGKSGEERDEILLRSWRISGGALWHGHQHGQCSSQSNGGRSPYRGNRSGRDWGQLLGVNDKFIARRLGLILLCSNCAMEMHLLTIAILAMEMDYALIALWNFISVFGVIRIRLWMSLLQIFSAWTRIIIITLQCGQELRLRVIARKGIDKDHLLQLLPSCTNQKSP